MPLDQLGEIAEPLRLGSAGEIDRDQVEDYAARNGMAIEQVERWLAPVLNYSNAPVAEAAE